MPTLRNEQNVPKAFCHSKVGFLFWGNFLQGETYHKAWDLSSGRGKFLRWIYLSKLLFEVLFCPAHGCFAGF